MKWGKQFRLRQRDIWEEYYIDYKKLKQFIRKLQEDADYATTAEIKASHTGDDDIDDDESNTENSSNAAPLKPVLVLENEEYAKVRRKFVAMLKKEVTKAINHYKSQLKVFKENLERCRNFTKNRPGASTTPTVAKSSSLPKAKPTKSLASMFDLLKEKKRDSTRAATMTMHFRRVLLRVSRFDSDLEEFLVINSTSVVKICKKFDKRVPLPPSHPTLKKPTSTAVVPGLVAQFEKCINGLHKHDDEVAQMLEQHARVRVKAPTSPDMKPSDTANKVAAGGVIEDEDDDVSDDELGEDVRTVYELRLDQYPPGEVTRVWLALTTDGLGNNVSIPVIIAKGRYAGPRLCLTAALHGNELNGIPLIHKLVRELDLSEMSGTVIAVPVLNPIGYNASQRYFGDGQDLNRLFPGKADGNCGQVFVHQIMQKLILNNISHLIDLHTASLGRVNSLYVRADMNTNVTRRMALLIGPQVVVHNTAPDGSLRGAAMAAGVPAITVEIGNPSTLHARFISAALTGVERIMEDLLMVPIGADEDDVEEKKKEASNNNASSASLVQAARERSPSVVAATLMSRLTVSRPLSAPPVLCSSSKWYYTRHGGILRVPLTLASWIKKGDIIATVSNIFGDVVRRYRSPYDAVVIGKSTNPTAQAGDRIVHLGVVSSEFALKVDDGHA
eukprot:TRINITY_DN67993_c1_g14_i1.p1 TRINITY_DN67993_c1_g14~~TRINITY_DN67993_c1_g14_i1.p1  ORF type:complete len:672 (+),score=364.41 TRINITY_DN67993_c1_g14_i1:178-2193(+)